MIGFYIENLGST